MATSIQKCVNMGLHTGPISHLKSLTTSTFSWHTMCGVPWHLEGLYGVFHMLGRRPHQAKYISMITLWMYGGLGNKQNHKPQTLKTTSGNI
jgi:hypothetical protein